MRRALQVVSFACLAACGGGSGPALTGPAFCDQWLTEWCNHQLMCCTDATGRYPTVAACISAQRASCTLGVGTAFQSTTPTAVFDSARASDALNMLRTADCSMSAPSLDAYNPPLVRGTLAAGADCSPLGGDLSPTLACGPTYRCLLGASRTGALSGQCVLEGTTIGAPCASQTCIEGLYCDIGASGASGNCQMQLGPGAPCTSDFACALGTCADTGTGTGTKTCPLGFGGTGTTWCVPGASRTPLPIDAGSEDAGGAVDAGTD